MRTFTIMLLVFSTMQCAYAQNYKVKKDVVYNSKEQIGRVDGKITSFQFFNDADDLVMTGKLNSYQPSFPFAKDKIWYHLQFPQLEKEAKVGKYYYLSIRSLFKQEFAAKGIDLTPEGFSMEDFEKVEDISEEVNRDTLEITKNIDYYKRNLAKAGPFRMSEKELSFITERDPETKKSIRSQIMISQGFEKEKISEEKTKTHRFWIGRIHFVYKPAQTALETTIDEIYIYKKIDEPLEENRPDLVKTFENDHLLAAYIDMTEGVPSLYIFEEDKSYDPMKYNFLIKKGAPGYSRETATSVAKWMVERGLL